MLIGKNLEEIHREWLEAIIEREWYFSTVEYRLCYPFECFSVLANVHVKIQSVYLIARPKAWSFGEFCILIKFRKRKINENTK